MGRFANFVSSLTGDSPSKSSKAGHDVRTDSGAREGKDKDVFKESAPRWAPEKTESGISFSPKDRGPKDR